MENYNNIFKNYLAKTGKKYSKEIEIIIKTIFNIHAHFTKDELSKKLINKKIKESTILETLNNLISSGLIRKINFQNKEYFEQIYGHAHHDHLICLKCNKIFPFRNKIIEQEQEKITKEMGFELLKHSLVIMGICSKCLNKKETLDEYEFQKEDKGLDKEEVLPLSMINSEEKVKIVGLHGGRHFIHRLISMGLNIGDTVEVISNDFQGPFLLKIKNTRIGIGHGLTHRIYVKRI
jgi:Fur family ferric uptake transcriptional regulator